MSLAMPPCYAKGVTLSNAFCVAVCGTVGSDEGQMKTTIHERLKALREKRFATAQDAAEAMGISYSTYAGHENGSRGISRSAAIRYARFFQVSLDFIVTGADTQGGDRGVVILNGDRMPVQGYVLAGAFQETYTPDGPAFIDISGDVRYKGQRQFALLVKGPSINREARDGEYAICVAFDGKPANDDLVVVERRRAGLFEATIKKVRVTPSGIELWPDSDHPDHQAPIRYTDGLNPETDEVVIVAKVTGFYRPRR